VQQGCVEWPAGLARRYRDEGYWLGETLADLLRGPAAEDGDRIAVTTRDRRVGYAALDAEADRIAAGLHGLGVKPGDRVVVQLPNVVEFVSVCVALFRLSALPVLALPVHRRSEIGYLCEHTEATALVIPAVYRRFDHRELAREIRERVPTLAHVVVAGDPDGFVGLADVAAQPVDLPPPDPADVALFLLSGGTTGRPKLIPRTHDDYAYQMRATARAMGLTAGGAYLAALPAAHNAALGCPGVLGALRVGARAVLADSPSPDEVFPLIAREAVTLTTLMPAFLPLWMDTAAAFGADLSALTIEVGGARLEPEVARRVEPALGATLTRWFGTAEGLLSFTRRDDPAHVRHTTEGRPLSPADEIRILDEDGAPVAPGEVGELVVQGPYTIRGYYRAEEYNRTAFTADGFYRTGDLVRLAAEGNLVIEGRVKDVVNRGGEKVPTGEVESHLRTHPGVREAAVVAVPDRTLGEKSCAFVTARRTPPPTLAELREHLSVAGLADYKLPDRLEVVETLPYTGVGKVDKAALRASLT
jgi:2,3-dihydroxybenzoate-AMP ligase